MKVWKKGIALTLSVLMLTTILPVTTFAEETDHTEIGNVQESNSASTDERDYSETDKKEEDAYLEADGDNTSSGAVMGEGGVPSGSETEEENATSEKNTDEDDTFQETDAPEDAIEVGEVNQDDLQLSDTNENNNYGVVIESGDCSASADDNLTWTIYDSDADSIGDTLVIEGSGAMRNFNFSSGAPWASYREDLEHLILDSRIVHIGNYSFDGYKNLTGILNLPQGLTSIGEYAFSNTQFYGSLVLPDSITSIGKSAFYDCQGFSGTLKLPENLSIVKADTFRLCTGFTGDLVIPENIITIEESAFYYCNGLTGDLVIPDSVESIGEEAFYWCVGMQGSLKLPKNLRRIEPRVFYGCRFSGNLVLPETVVSIGDSAFTGNGFTGDLNLPEQLKIISASAFSLCRGLTGTVILPEAVESIGRDVFHSCLGINAIVILNAECNIAAGEWTIPKNSLIYGYENSTAQAYAVTYGRKFLKDHSYHCDTQAPTCVEKGKEIYTCVICGDVYTVEIPAAGHIKVKDEAVAPTCTDNGKTEGSHCSVCGEIIKAQQDIESMGHEYSKEWTIDKDATCTEAGSRSHHCIRCDEKADSESLVATGHEFGNWTISQKPTYETDGLEIRTCRKCEDVEERAIPKLETVVPDTPEIQTKVEGDDIIISWDNFSGKVWYEVYYSTEINGKYDSYSVIRGIDKTIEVKFEGKIGIPYYFKVKAVSQQNGKLVSSEFSEVKEGKIELTKLSGLKAVARGVRRTSLSWDEVPNAEGYLIYAQKNGKYGYAGMTTTGTVFTDTKALDSDYNYYWVFPYIKDSTGKMYPGSCMKYVYAKGVTAAVTNLKAVSQKGGVQLTWSASYGAEGYLIYGKTATGTYGYKRMTTRGYTFTDKKASTKEFNFYWVYPYHKDKDGKMIVGGTPKYVYGKAK